MKKTFTKIIYRLLQNSIFFLAGISFCAGMVVVLSRGDTWEDLGKIRNQNYRKKSRGNPDVRREEYNDLIDRGTLWKIIDEDKNNKVDENENNIILDKKGTVIISNSNISDELLKEINNPDENLKLYVDGKIKTSSISVEGGGGMIPPGFCIFSHTIESCPEGFSKDDTAFDGRTIRAIKDEDLDKLGEQGGSNDNGSLYADNEDTDVWPSKAGTNWPPYINVIICCKD